MNSSKIKKLGYNNKSKNYKKSVKISTNKNNNQSN